VTETNDNHHVVVRITYDKSTFDKLQVSEIFHYNSGNKTLSYSYTEWQGPFGYDIKPDREYKTRKQLSDSDAKSLIDTIDSAITKADKSGHQTYSWSRGMNKS
jgi:hypothetical protein